MPAPAVPPPGSRRLPGARAHWHLHCCRYRCRCRRRLTSGGMPLHPPAGTLAQAAPRPHPTRGCRAGATPAGALASLARRAPARPLQTRRGAWCRRRRCRRGCRRRRGGRSPRCSAATGRAPLRMSRAHASCPPARARSAAMCPRVMGVSQASRLHAPRPKHSEEPTRRRWQQTPRISGGPLRADHLQPPRPCWHPTPHACPRHPPAGSPRLPTAPRRPHRRRWWSGSASPAPAEQRAA
jgi:hypothetical protein